MIRFLGTCGTFVTHNVTRSVGVKMAYSKKIPDRWEDYIPLGKRVVGTRFVAFKVPLKETLCRSLPEDLRFTPSDLLQETKNCGMNLGLVIDLTNTQRYYGPQIFLDAGIEYKKIFTAGKVVPSADVKMDFLSAVDDFIERNPDEDVLVGVHCTHGLNRTGHLVCRYMIDRLDMEPDAAIQLYNEARGHDMERENYIEDLRTCKTDMVSYKEFRNRTVATAANNGPCNTNQHNYVSNTLSLERKPQQHDNHENDAKNGWGPSNDRRSESTRHVFNNRHEKGRRGYQSGISRQWHMQNDKGPGSGWSLPHDGHQGGRDFRRSLSHDEQVHRKGPGSGWSLPDDGQPIKTGPGSGWSLQYDESRPSTRDFPGSQRDRNARGRGSGWSLPDDRQFEYGRDSRQYMEKGARGGRFHHGYNGHSESSSRGHSQGRFHGQRDGYNNYRESSPRNVYNSRYNHVGNHGRNRPYDVPTKHHSENDTQGEQ